MIDGENCNNNNNSYKSKFHLNNSEHKIRASIEESPESIEYHQTYVNKSRPSFVENSELKSIKIVGFAPLNMKINQSQNTPANDHRSSNVTASFSY